VSEEAVEEGEEGVDRIERRAAGTGGEFEGGIIDGDELVEALEVGVGGIAFDAAKGIEVGRLESRGDPVIEVLDRSGERCLAVFMAVTVIPEGALEDLAGVGDFGGDAMASDGEGRLGFVGHPVLGSAEENIAGSEAVDGGHELAVGIAE